MPQYLRLPDKDIVRVCAEAWKELTGEEVGETPKPEMSIAYPLLDAQISYLKELGYIKPPELPLLSDEEIHKITAECINNNYAFESFTKRGAKAQRDLCQKTLDLRTIKGE